MGAGALEAMPHSLHIVRSLEWAELRAKLQQSVVIRQVHRTHAASLHAQMLHPPPLPPASRLREAELRSAGVEALLPIIGLKREVHAAHKRALAQAEQVVKTEEARDIELAEINSERFDESASSASKIVTGDGISPAERIWLASIESASSKT